VANRHRSEKQIVEPLATPSPDAASTCLPAAGGAVDDALAACAALVRQWMALQPLADRAAQRQALSCLAPALQAASAAVARLDVAVEARRFDGDGDVLTGLADRVQLAAAGAALALRYPDTPLTLVAVDVDHLRHVNDAWSRATGDAVLRGVADVLRAQSRPQDVLARVDADVFVVALGGPVSTTRALLVAERLRAAIEGRAWTDIGAGLQVTASIGVAARSPGESLDDVLARAGAALRECKRGGRNQVRSSA
jgi:diguanylate cyclase (GGDEF)-like protein